MANRHRRWVALRHLLRPERVLCIQRVRAAGRSAIVVCTDTACRALPRRFAQRKVRRGGGRCFGFCMIALARIWVEQVGFGPLAKEEWRVWSRRRRLRLSSLGFCRGSSSGPALESSGEVHMGPLGRRSRRVGPALAGIRGCLERRRREAIGVLCRM